MWDCWDLTVDDRRITHGPSRNWICALLFASVLQLLTLNMMPPAHASKRKRPSSIPCLSTAKPLEPVNCLLSETSEHPRRSLDTLIKWLRSQGCTINKVIEKSVPGTQFASPHTLYLCALLICRIWERIIRPWIDWRRRIAYRYPRRCSNNC